MSETKREKPSIEETNGDVSGITNQKLELRSIMSLKLPD